MDAPKGRGFSVRSVRAVNAINSDILCRSICSRGADGRILTGAGDAVDWGTMTEGSIGAVKSK